MGEVRSCPMRMPKKENRLVIGIATAFVLLLIGGIVDAQKSDTAAGPEPTSEPRPVASPSSSATPSPRPSPTELSKKEKAKLRAERRRERRREQRQIEREKARLDAERALVTDKASDTVQTLFDYYNEGNFVLASAYVADRFVQQCGSVSKLTNAFAQNDQAERLDYLFVSVRNVEVDGRAAKADVTYRNTDEDTGEDWGTYSNGLRFVREDGEWVLNDLLPLGVGAFC